VARLDLCSVSLAQNPKSAVAWLDFDYDDAELGLTDFDVSSCIKKNIVTLDIAMNDVLSM
jgi:hypothetical protein